MPTWAEFYRTLTEAQRYTNRHIDLLYKCTRIVKKYLGAPRCMRH